MSYNSVKHLFSNNKVSVKAKNLSKCLFCKRIGNHNIFIADYNNYMNSSRVQLLKFIIKVIGEEPCYSVSQLICKQCYLLLDRLDTCQTETAELINYFSSSYKETKFEILGSRQKISELIESSLSNIKNFKSGTTLNVCDELSVTVFRESLRKEDPSNQASSTENNHLVASTPNVLNRTINNSETNYVKLNKKRKISSQNELNKRQRRTIVNNNNINLVENNISHHCNGLNSESSLLKSVQINGGETSESESDQSAKVEISSRGSDISKQSSLSKRENCLNSKSSSSSNSRGNSSHSSSGSSSSSSGSSSNSSSSSSDSNNNNSSTSDDSSDEETNVNRDKSKNVAEMEVNAEDVKKEEENICEVKDIKKENDLDNNEDQQQQQQDSKNDSEKEDIEAIESHTAEAVFLQTSLASNIFESFLSTSMWMNSGSDSVTQSSPMRLQQKQNQVLHSGDDDLTESLNTSAALSIHDKKKRLELKNTGQSYVNTKGKLIDAKRVWPQDCSRCTLKCNGRLSEERRLVIFAEYWGLGDYDLQREYLALHMERDERIGPSGLTRTVVLYYLTYDNKRYQVCRQFFLKTLDVSEKASRIVLEKKLKGELGVEAHPLPLAVSGDDGINDN